MIYAMDPIRTNLEGAEIGSLVLVYDYTFAGAAGLIVKNQDNGKAIFSVDGPSFGEGPISSSTSLLSFGKSYARFDRSSYASYDAVLPTGALIFTNLGVGIYKAPRSVSMGGALINLNGNRSHFHRDYETPAYLRWEIGYMREDDFALVAEIDVTDLRE